MIRLNANEVWRGLRIGLGVVVTAYAIIAVLVFAIPHLPLANMRTFNVLLKTQMAIDRDRGLKHEGVGTLLFLGSSVVERSVQEPRMDSLLRVMGLPTLRSSNSATGGFFAATNLLVFRAMLERGMRPAAVVYGVFLQELNDRSKVHANVSSSDTSLLKLRDKSVWNVLRYGPSALRPLLAPDLLHIYLFAAHNAFREVRDPTVLDRVIFGKNMFERDSTYELSENFLKDLISIEQLCKEEGIPFAFFNAPLRPTIGSLADLPYLHRKEAYERVYQYAKREGIPIWNYDVPGEFSDSEFQDTYHLNYEGSKKLTTKLAAAVAAWLKGRPLRQDPPSSLFGDENN